MDYCLEKIEVGLYAYCLNHYRFSGKTQREVGKYCGCTGDGGASKQRKRLALTMPADKELSVRFNKLPRLLSKYIVQV